MAQDPVKRESARAKKKRSSGRGKTAGGRTKGPSGELIIVESPTKVRTLRKFLGRKYHIIATKGHILDLPKSKLGVDIENGFAPHYAVIHGKGQVIRDLVKDARSRGKIYLAPDPDREGEAIAYHLLLKLDKAPGDIKRVTFNEITRNAVLRGLEQATEIDMQKVHAQQARRILDRLVGYQVSPILWQTVYRGLSAGRVQSVALRMICSREAEIEAFRPTEYWSIHADFATEDGSRFTAKLFRIDGEEAVIPNGEKAGLLTEEIGRQQFSVKSVVRDEKKRRPSPPYITSTLQQDASRQAGFSTQKTMIVAQQLYEGIELGSEGPVGLITYMRTDSVRIADEAIAAARSTIESRFGKSYLPGEPRRYASRKRSQDAHEAIRPTDLSLDPAKVKKHLTSDQFKLYNLIYGRFLASQMSSAVYDQEIVDIEGGAYLFRASATRLKFDGYLRVYEEAKGDNGDGKNGETALPHLVEKQKLSLEQLTPDQHFTKPPPRFSEASLVKDLESNGIGRPSTYAQIINTLKNRRYVQIDRRRLLPTRLGTMVNEILVKHFEKIFNVEFTAAMEDELDRIEEGRDDWQKVLRDFYGPFSENLGEVMGRIPEIKSETQRDSNELCDKCGASMIIKWGRNGQFLACSAYPDCKNTRPVDGKDNGEPVERDCPECGEPLIYRQGRFGKFIACSSYPDCRYTESITTGVKCPVDGCSGELSQRRTSRGKVFWGCSKYPDCKYATWYKPVARQCSACGHPILVEKETRRLGHHLACPKCKHVDNTAEDEPVTELENARK